jgi:hypothetical protein
MHPLAIAFVVLAAMTAFVSYVHSQRYGGARALEMGIPPHIARSGRVDEGGATAYDRRISWEILLGSYKTTSSETKALGRLARRWTLSCIALTVAAIATMAATS